MFLMYNILVHILNYCTTKSRMVGIDLEALRGVYFHYSHPRWQEWQENKVKIMVSNNINDNNRFRYEACNRTRTPPYMPKIPWA